MNIDQLEKVKFEVGQLWLDASIRFLESRTTYNSNYIHAGNRSVHHKCQNSAIETLILCHLCMAGKERKALVLLNSNSESIGSAERRGWTPLNLGPFVPLPCNNDADRPVILARCPQNQIRTCPLLVNLNWISITLGRTFDPIGREI